MDCYSILYSIDGEIFQCGPFETEAKAMQWAKTVNGDNEDCEFDIYNHHVYMMYPNHRLVALCSKDLE